MLNLKTVAVAITLSIASIGAFAQAASAPATPRVDQREAKQQASIAQGAASGQLSAKETNRLEKRFCRSKKAELSKLLSRLLLKMRASRTGWLQTRLGLRGHRAALCGSCASFRCLR